MGKNQVVTLESAKKLFSERGFELLETEYINSRTRMKHRCFVHDDVILFKTYNTVKNLKGCTRCRNGRTRKSFEEVQSAFEDRGLELLAKSYKNGSQELEFICKTHPDKVQRITYLQLSAQKNVCSECRKEHGRKSRKVDFSIVKKLFIKAGFELLESKFVNNKHPMRYKCPNHPNEISKISYSNLRAGQGCPHCFNEKRSSLSREDGGSRIKILLRQRTKAWREEISKKYDYRCFITGQKTEELDVHHLVPFSSFFKQAHENAGLEIKRYMKDYSDEELKRLYKSFDEVHSFALGVPIEREVHKLFHKLYGWKATESDLVEFKEKYDSEYKKII